MELIRHHNHDEEKLDESFFNSPEFFPNITRIVKEGKLEKEKVISVIPLKFLKEFNYYLG